MVAVHLDGGFGKKIQHVGSAMVVEIIKGKNADLVLHVLGKGKQK